MSRTSFFGFAILLSGSLLTMPNVHAVISKPLAPTITSITSSSVKKGKVTITITIALPSSNGGSKITGSKINAGDKSCTMEGTKTSCKIKNINNGKNFRVTAVTKNKKGYSLKSQSVNFFSGSSYRSQSRETVEITPVPWGKANALFYVNPRFIPEIAQSVVVDRPFNLTSTSIIPIQITWVRPEWFSASEEDRHGLEVSKESYKPIPAAVTLTIWKSSSATLAYPIHLTDGFVKVFQQTFRNPIEIGKGTPYEMTLDQPVRLESGVQLFVFSFELYDPNILSLLLSGRESGTNTIGGPSQDRPTDCVYTRSDDSYPDGRLYRGSGSLPYTGTIDNFVGFGNEFLEHSAKVAACQQIGYYNDIFNPGDLQMFISGNR